MPDDNKGMPAAYQPTLRDMVLLETPEAVKLSPDGGKVAIKVRAANWNENQYENQCYVHDRAAGTTRRLNRSGDVAQMAWLDEHTLALLIDGRSAQVYIYEGLVGDGWQVTTHKGGVEWFAPFAGGLLFLAADPKKQEKKKRLAKFGKYTRFEQEKSSSALYYVDLARLRDYQRQEKQCTEEEADDLVLPVVELSKLLEEPLAIQSVCPSPAGDAVYFNCWTGDDLVYFRETSAFCIDLDVQAAVAGYLEREIKKKNGKEDDAQEKEDEEQAYAYLGEIKRLQLPRAARVAAVSPNWGAAAHRLSRAR